MFLGHETGTEGELGRERHIVQGQTKAVLEQEPGVLTVAQKHSACFGQDSESLTAPLRGQAGTGTRG